MVAATITFVLVIGIVGINEVSAKGNEKITEMQDLEHGRVMEECKEVNPDDFFILLKIGQVISSESFPGSDTKAVIMSNGDLYCWGYNKYGQVGNGTTVNQSRPVKVLSDVKSVISSYYYGTVAAITGNGDLYCWGHNNFGQAGSGITINQSWPVKVLSDVKSVIFYCGTTAAITGSGDLYCWGLNNYEQAGNGITISQNRPVKVLSDLAELSDAIYLREGIMVMDVELADIRDNKIWTGNGLY